MHGRVQLPHAEQLYRVSDFDACARWQRRTQHEPGGRCEPLSAGELEASRAVLSASPRLNRLMARLREGRRGVRIALFGASVSEQGGCIGESPAKRCMQHGKDGWLMRFGSWLEATWPRAEHQLRNYAKDMTSARSFIACLYSLLAADPDLVILEMCSMAYVQKKKDVETLARALLALPSAPALLYINICDWCHTRPNGSRVLLDAYRREGGHHPSDSVESFTGQLAHHYNQSVVSMRAALSARVHDARLQGRCPFRHHRHRIRGVYKVVSPSLPDVGGDGLHPYDGPLANAHIAAAMANWLHTATLVTPLTRDHEPAAEPLLPPAVASARRAAGACLTVGPDRVGHDSGMAAWSTAHCGGSQSQCDNEPPDEVTLGSCSAALPTPRVWFHCARWPPGPAAKESPAAVALSPGATLRVHVISTERISALKAASSALTQHTLYLEYATSWEGMGRVEAWCSRGCSCPAGLSIDAHVETKQADARISSFKVHKIEQVKLGPSSAPCTLSLRVLPSTSSGGYQFRVRSVSFSRAV